MNRFVKKARRGFSLVELLAVVLILAVLAAVAVPLYVNSRRSAAARACKAQIAQVCASQSAYFLRNGIYATSAQLVGAPEGLEKSPVCPLDNTTAYTWSTVGTVAAPTAFTITCGKDDDHALVVGVAGDYARTMPVPASEGAL